MAGHTDEELQQLFTSFDLDGGGTISVEELDEVAKQVGIVMPHDELFALMQKVDKDGSGELDLGEFVQLMHVAEDKFMAIIKALQASYLDDKARAAGAEDCEWYTSEMLMARDKLRADPVVEEALRTAWRRCAAPSSQAADRFLRQEYVVMTRLVYLALKAQAMEYDFDPEDCMQSLEDDWAEDGGSKGFLTFEDFAKSWFQARSHKHLLPSTTPRCLRLAAACYSLLSVTLCVTSLPQLADLNTEHVSASEYASFIRRLTEQISSTDGGYTRAASRHHACLYQLHPAPAPLFSSTRHC